MRFRAVTVSTVGVPPMSFEFDATSVSAAMEFLCRSVPMMSARYDFELWTVPEESEDSSGSSSLEDLIARHPVCLGRTRSHVTTRFVKSSSGPISREDLTTQAAHAAQAA